MVSTLGPPERVRQPVDRFRWMVAATCAPFLLVVLAHHVRTPTTNRLAVSVAALTLAAHVPTTASFYLDRSFRRYLMRHRGRYVAAPVCVVVVGVALAWWAPTRAVAAAFSLLIAWQLHHFTRQNLGVLSFLLRSARRPPVTREERSLVSLTGVAGILGFAPHYAGLPGIGPSVQSVLWAAGLITLLLAAVRLARVWPSDPLRAAALCGVMGFYLPLFLYRSNTFTATVAYSAAHGAQYLLMIGHVAAGRSRRQVATWTLVLAMLVVGGGHLLDRASLQNGTDLRWLYGMGLGITAAHFIIDAGVWRLRDPDQRAWMRERFAFL